MSSHVDDDRSELRPTKTECNHTAERVLKLILESPDDTAVRINSDPNPMYVTVENAEFAFWCHNYTKGCQERRPIEAVTGRSTTVVDQLHEYANAGYGLETVPKDRIDTDERPRPTTYTNYQ